MTRRTERRDFLRQISAAVVGFGTAAKIGCSESHAANETIEFGCIGVGGEGLRDSVRAARTGHVAAICDVDEDALSQAAQRYPKARKYFDWRKMFDEMGSRLDAVTISTPDHSHAPATARALREGIACYTQKPLTHAISEARKLGQLAAQENVATQMGNQYSSHPGLREAVALVRAGLLGQVKEVHVWSDRPHWQQGMPRPKGNVPVPAHLHWDLFLGPARRRPYNPAYHPFTWRAWWDFGTGALGDMGCHTINMPFAALDLRDPVSVQAQTSGHNRETYPEWCVIHYEFAATPMRPGLKLVWYDGKQLPPKHLFSDLNLVSSGALLVGDRGSLYAPGDYANDFLLLGIDRPKDLEFERSAGHFEEFAAAIRGQGPAMSNFANYAGPLTETVLLGNLAVWADGQKIQWDAKSMTATNAPELKTLVFPEYRDGYTI